jgi:hypothetical protein
MTRHNTPPITEINLVKGHEHEGVRKRQPSHPFIDPRDTEFPEKVTEPEREVIYRELHWHEERIDALEAWKQDTTNAKSIPATFNGPGGFSITGNWRFIIGIAILATVLAALFIVMRYGQF